MNELTKEEQEIINKIKKPLISFDEIQKAMDAKAQEFGYENHMDFLSKTGWLDRFNNSSV